MSLDAAIDDDLDLPVILKAFDEEVIQLPVLSRNDEQVPRCLHALLGEPCDFLGAPHVIADPRFHGRRDPKRLMNPREVVPGGAGEEDLGRPFRP